MSSETRDPSRPVPGGARVGVDVAIASILVWLAGLYVPVEVLPQVQVLITAVVAGLIGGLGKFARNSGSVFGEIF